tara:strand:+ start:2955 stop:3206 length:252 start_codon:yes stop_codon:yes gene_type:complete
MRTTYISLDRPTYYKEYYIRNRDYLRHRQRLRYYRNTPKFYQLLKEYNKILLEKSVKDKEYKINKNNKLNKLDNEKHFIITFN